MKPLKLLAGILLLAAVALPAKADLLKDYSHIRGNHYFGWQQDEATIRKELGYGKAIGMNSTRICLYYRRYKENPQKYLNDFRNYVRIANSMGISVMPIIWDGCSLDPAILKPSFWEAEGDPYVKALIDFMKGEDGIICWDVMNEPTCNSYHDKTSSEEEFKEHRAEIFRHVRHYCELVKKLDKKNPITVGVQFSRNLEEASADLVDIITFHDYLPTSSRTEAAWDIAEAVAKKYNKPLMNSETGCTGRGNPYEFAIKKCYEHHCGFYAFELLIHGGYAPIHGFFYPDGTIRDASIITSFMGIFRNDDLSTMVRENPNQEHYAEKAIAEAQAALGMDARRPATLDALLEAAEYCANLLEGSQMVPMWDVPTAHIKAWRKMPAAEVNAWEVRSFLYDLMTKLKEACQL
ncbi:MAG: cellulase family glycosylhydrolase [Bacteroidales bacterium]|nr:cellulase family glycosylhydrolase [Bacteroidales bacterium]MBP5795642.1 cellulase family glycosylhydrolase [Bacteroidales bacterium]